MLSLQAPRSDRDRSQSDIRFVSVFSEHAKDDATVSSRNGRTNYWYCTDKIV